MIHYSVIQELVGKEAVVYIAGSKSFEGKLSYQPNQLLLIVTPTDPWTAKRYGNSFIDVSSVIAIREVKPRPVSEKDEGEDDCNDCDESKG